VGWIPVIRERFETEALRLARQREEGWFGDGSEGLKAEDGDFHDSGVGSGERDWRKDIVA
jgi:hypothetical protein